MKKIIMTIEIIPEPVTRTVSFEVPDDADPVAVSELVSIHQFWDEEYNDLLDVGSVEIRDAATAETRIDQEVTWEYFVDAYGYCNSHHQPTEQFLARVRGENIVEFVIDGIPVRGEGLTQQDVERIAGHMRQSYLKKLSRVGLALSAQNGRTILTA
jgi:hypothetical protein